MYMIDFYFAQFMQEEIERCLIIIAQLDNGTSD